MSRLKIILVIVITIIAISGCNSTNAVKTPDQTSNPPGGNPYPITGNTTPQNTGNATPSLGNTSYPAPNATTQGQNANPDNFVTKLTVPNPSSGKSVVTGQLMTGDNQPFITTLYLASAKPSGNANQPPEVNFSAISDPMAIQELGTGRFMFIDVNPGLYAIVVRTKGDSFFIKDAQGTTLIIELKANEIKDLGVLTAK